MKSLHLAATIAALSAGLAVQQQPPTFRSGADLVEVDAVVIDAAGQPVRGLTATDFVVRDRGNQQAIATFQEISHDPISPGAGVAPVLVHRDVAENRSVAEDRIVVLVLDDLHIYRERSDRARDIASHVLTDLRNDSMMAVLFTSGHGSSQVTDDPVVLRDAVATLKGRQAWRRPHTANDKQMADRIDPDDGLDSIMAKLQKAQDANLQDFEDNLALVQTLQQASHILESASHRRKAFVLVSEGFGKDLSGLFGAMTPADDAPQGGLEYATSGNAGATMNVEPTQYQEFALLQMMEAMRRSNVATYAIDPRGKVAAGDLARECFPSPHPGDDPCSEALTDWNSPVRQAQHGLEMISTASGGFAVTNTDDFTSGLRRIADDLDHYYVLGFYPTDTRGKGYRALTVAVPGRPGLTIRFRHGYMPGPTTKGKQSTDALVALASGLFPTAGLRLRLTAVAEPAASRMARVVLVLEVSLPRVDIEEKDGHLRDTLKYTVLAIDQKTSRARTLAGLEAALSLTRSDSTAPLPNEAVYQVAQPVDLAPGSYELRVAATSTKLATGGSVYLHAEVPDFQAHATIGGLWIGHEQGPRVPLATRPGTQGRRGGGGETSGFDVPFAPTLDRAFDQTDTLQVFAEATTHGIAHPRVAIDVVDRSGRVVLSPSPSFTTGEVIRMGTTILLSTLEPGAYVLRATLQDDAGRAATRETGFTVR